MSKRPAIAHIDLMPLGGIAGDMFAAAMFSAYPELHKEFCNDLEALGVDGIAATLEDKLSAGLQAKYFNVVQNTSEKPPRTLAAVTEFLNASALAEPVAMHATGLFTLLAQAEADVHGKRIDTIHFHEVSDWDSMVDLVAAAGIIERLDCPLWRIGALPLGGGTVNTAHGDIPIPAPATIALLKGFQWQDDGEPGERVTPTGAAIAAYIKAVPIGETSQPAALCATGSGCGSRELDGRANLLRVTVFAGSERSSDCQPDVSEDEVFRLAFEVDDMTQEEIAWSADTLRDTTGVYDVACIAMQGKKGRASTGIRIIGSVDQMNNVMSRCFSLTSTIGIRHETVQRSTLNRSEQKANNVTVKVVDRPSDQFTAKTSSDDLSACQSLSERRQLAEAGRVAALKNNERRE